MQTFGSRSAAVPSASAHAGWPRIASFLLAIPGCVWLVSLARFYRRFIFEDAGSKVWGLADDMYISAGFGRSLFRGAGFVWYEGAPKVESISNPLWAVALGALHMLPWFSEERLGLFVVALNALMLLTVILLFAHTAHQALGLRAVPWWASRTQLARRSALLVSCAAALLLPWCWSLTYWSAEGFEVALLALLTFAGVYLALLPRTAASCLALGLVLVLGFATRMDFLVLASAIIAVALGHTRGSRLMLLWTILISTSLLYFLLVLRHAYFGEWLPSTFQLESPGWGARLRHGLQQNQLLLLTAWLAFVPLSAPRVRRNLGDSLPCVVAGLWAFGLTVLYSCYVAADSTRSFAGYDRHTAAAALLLCWSLCMLIAAAARTWYMRTICSAWCLLLVAAPVLARHGVQQLQHGLLAAEAPAQGDERAGMERMRARSAPSAGLARCPAGASVYFSHRRGPDPLASQPPSAACWRQTLTAAVP